MNIHRTWLWLLSYKNRTLTQYPVLQATFTICFQGRETPLIQQLDGYAILCLWGGNTSSWPQMMGHSYSVYIHIRIHVLKSVFCGTFSKIKLTLGKIFSWSKWIIFLIQLTDCLVLLKYDVKCVVPTSSYSFLPINHTFK